MKTNPTFFDPNLCRNAVRFCLLLAVFLAPAARAQFDNTYWGTTYLESDTEIGGSVSVNGDIHVNSSASIDGTLYVGGSLNVGTLNAGSLNYNYLNFTISGNFELFSGFSPNMTSAWGVGGSWLHSSLDLGDLTASNTDIPAFNISQLYVSGNYLPTIYFTGYDAATRWVWRQNGLAAMSNTTLLTTQMELAETGNLSVFNPGTGSSIRLNPEGGEISVVNASGSLAVTDINNNSIIFSPLGPAITFYNGTTQAAVSISPQSASLEFDGRIGGQGYGYNASAQAANAFAIGNTTVASGNGSFAIGNHVTAAYYNSIVMGQWNAAISGSGSGNTTWVGTDPLFVLGNGTSSTSKSNALVILKNGNTTFNGNTTVNGTAFFNGTASVLNGNVSMTGNVTMSQVQGDILMGQFGN